MRTFLAPLFLTFILCLISFLLLNRSHERSPSELSIQSAPTATLIPAEPTPVPNRVYLPAIARGPVRILIEAVHIDSRLSGEPDEAILLYNAGADALSLSGWRIQAGGRSAYFPPTSTLRIEAGASIWCARQADGFRMTFGFAPDCEWRESDPTVPNLVGAAPSFANQGGRISIGPAKGEPTDLLLYGDESTLPSGWTGPALQPYQGGSLSPVGQVLLRKRDQESGRPLDSDRAADWRSDSLDLEWGKQLFWPGWSIWTDQELGLAPIGATATVTVALGPEGIFPVMAPLLAGAKEEIKLALYTFEHPELARILSEAAGRGVRVTILVEGAPAGGVGDLQRWTLDEMTRAGVQIYWMAADDAAPRGYAPRYRFHHAKYGIIDGRWAFVGSENFTRESMPPLEEPISVVGRRGVYLFTDGQPVLDALKRIFAYDVQPARFLDLRGYEPDRDGPPVEYQPDPFLPEPGPGRVVGSFAVTAPMTFALSLAPEDGSRPDSSLRRLVDGVGPDGRIEWMQLYEQRHWGAVHSNPLADPNPRLEAILDAARRGARVRLLLDAYFDDGESLRSNRATAAYLHRVAEIEGLDIEVRAGNPAGAGIHAKMGLIADERGAWVAVGSLNGGEGSHKINREVMLLVQNRQLHDYIALEFEKDWFFDPPNERLLE